MKDMEIMYKLSEADKQDRNRALDGYMTVQKARDKAISILSSSGIALTSGLLTADAVTTASIVVKIAMFIAFGSFVMAILSLVFSYLFSEKAFEIYIKELDKGNKIRGRDNICTKITAAFNHLMFVFFVLGLFVLLSAFCLLVIKG